MAALGKLVVNLSANIAEFSSAMDKAAYTAANRMEAITKAATQAGAVMGTALVAGAGALANELRKFADAADETNKAAAKIGVSVEELQKLQYAAELSGVSSESLGTAMGKLAKGAADGSDAFKAMGIEVKQSDGTLKGTNQLMTEVAEKFAGYKDGAEKTALAQELFGKSGKDLIPLLNSGADGLAKMGDEAAALGIVFDANTGRAAEAFNDNLTRLGKVKDGIIAKIASGMLPMMENLTNRMVEAAKGTQFFDGVAQVLSVTLQTLISAGSIVYGVFEAVGKGLASVAAAVVNAANGDFQKAYDILKMGGEDMVGSVKQTVDRTMAIWDEGAAKAKAVADAPSGGLAAPIVGAVAVADKATKEMARKGDEVARIIQGLQDNILKSTKGEGALTVEKAMRLGATPEQIALIKKLIARGEELKRLEQESADATKRQQKLDEEAKRAKEELAAAGKKVFEDTRTPLENFNAEMARLNDLLQKGAIDWDTYERAGKKAMDELDSVKSKGKTAMEELTDAVNGFGKKATDAFVDFAFGAKTSFGDMISSMLKDLARMVVQRNVMGPLFNAIGGPGGFLSGLLPSFDGGGSTGYGARSGGLDGRGGFLAMMHPNETVIDNTRGGSGGGTNVVVNVNVESGGTQVSSQGGGAQLGQAIGAAVRAELINQRRPGGLLAA